MKTHINYTETQTLGPWCLWLIVCFISVALVVFSILRLRKLSIKERPIAFVLLILLATVMVQGALGTVFLMVFRMETKIDDTHIETRLFPMELTYRQFSWTDVDSFYIRTYSPLQEYGGWGLRSLGSQNEAFNFWGDEGLQLHLKTGKRVLIGTMEPARLEAALQGL